jgi:hypothetical protein
MWVTMRYGYQSDSTKLAQTLGLTNAKRPGADAATKPPRRPPPLRAPSPVVADPVATSCAREDPGDPGSEGLVARADRRGPGADRGSPAYPTCHKRDAWNEVYLSVVSIWGAIVKHRLCRLPSPHPPELYLVAQHARYQIAI